MRGILFIEPLVHATLAGNKTITRRSGGLELVNVNPDKWMFTDFKQDSDNKTFAVFRTSDIHDRLQLYPRYKVGEVLYIKEPTAKAKVINGKQIYAYLYGCNGNKEMISEFKWENKLFMPASRARHFIRITGIKCERLLDISDEDCIKEGIESSNVKGTQEFAYKVYGKSNDSWALTPKRSFLSLFKFANKMKASADTGNPWVWCYSFEYLPNYKLI